MSGLASLIEQLCGTCIETYRVAHLRIEADANEEEKVLAGGNSYRQVLELVQNGADAILELNEQVGPQKNPPRLAILLTEKYLYAANTGAPLSNVGIETLMYSNLSRKRGSQIGRFGLGFKSLLRLGGRVELFSSSGALGFDPERCKTEIRKTFELAESHPAPGLRLAWSVDRAEAEAADPLLSTFTWATTIVRAEIRDASIRPHLVQEIHTFPSAFLLFLPVAISLELDAGDGAKRLLRREPHGSDAILHDGDSHTRWRVAEEKEVHITDEAAIKDATHLHARESVPLAWAIPLEGREEKGHFWAFFPTDTPTRLPGILNAPWKLNDDRQALIRGNWNTALMREAAKLVTEHLSMLSTPEDPARPLDAFPRQLVLKDEPAAPLVNAIWATLKTAAIVPDARGNLRPALELRRPPQDDQKLHEQWCMLTGEEALGRWVHPSCYANKERGSRLDALASDLMPSLQALLLEKQGKATRPISLQRAQIFDWLNEIACSEAADFIGLFRLAEAYANKCDSETWGKERETLAVIPSAEGELCSPSQLLIAPGNMAVPGRKQVVPCLLDNDESQRLLTTVMNVQRLNEDGWRGLLDHALQAKNWEQFWETLRLAPGPVCDALLAQHGGEIQVRRQDESWVNPEEALFPGHIVAADDPIPGNGAVLIDVIFHQPDDELLKSIGVADIPTGNIGPDRYSSVVGHHNALMQTWLHKVEDDYRAKLDTSSSPQSGYLRPLNLLLPRGWMLLAQLKGLASARLTRHLLSMLGDVDAMVEFGHTSRPTAYPITSVAHPMRWYIQQHGHVAIGKSAVPLKSLLARKEAAVLAKVPDWQAIEANLGSLVAAPSPTAPNAQQIASLWQALFSHLATPDAIEKDCLGELWSAAAKDVQVPTSLPTSIGEVALAEVYVTSSTSLAQRARRQGKTAVTLDAETLALWLKQGARNLDTLFRPEWAEVLDAPMPLFSMAPELGEVLREEVDALACSVRDLTLVIEDYSQPIPCLFWEGALYLDPAQLKDMSRVERLKALLQEAGAAGWLKISIAEAQTRIADTQLQANCDRVAAGKNLPDRLLLAVGGKTDALIELLGEQVRSYLPTDCAPSMVAQLALARFGPTVLQKLKQTLENEGLGPPNRWGGVEARTFVTALGFPESFAVSAETRRDAEEFISGPIPLGKLHDYQDEVIEGLRALIQQGTGRRRAIVSLPTGGGKTRVTVQAAVDLVLKSESNKRSVLWIAQTDELCEQAVQAFRQVWLNRGVERTDLRIVRFWGGHPNPPAPATGQPTAVVASIQTLNNRIGREGLDWLSQPGFVVVDECHHAISPSYTGLLKWLDAEAPKPNATPNAEPPIVGLSATPFRGSNDDEENRRLHKRFDNLWLPSDQKALHDKLTQGGMLSKPVHEPLKSPAILPNVLNERIRQQTEMDSIQFENFLDELNRWLADDEDRNRLLLKTIAESPEKSILFFTNSVRHAEEMADRLNLQGIPAHAVSGDTPPSARREFLERFQRGEARVLCNHSVLTTGFDAPKTDMVLIARQVSSPVSYMQMVGRGLRGPKNGGTDHCRIVTVEENLGRFRDQLPYNYFAQYAVKR